MTSLSSLLSPSSESGGVMRSYTITFNNGTLPLVVQAEAMELNDDSMFATFSVGSGTVAAVKVEHIHHVLIQAVAS